MINYSNPQGRYSNISNPKNGYERVVEDRDNSKHLQVFMNGSWRHSHRCRESTNKECRMK
ncbi:MAG: hypothetical protein ACJ71K_15010 [Nitrososphaeraceae archaeon]